MSDNPAPDPVPQVPDPAAPASITNQEWIEYIRRLEQVERVTNELARRENVLVDKDGVKA